jgi:pSer/pThr/pTyr-binding forkhead associated (FHA) protein
LFHAEQLVCVLADPKPRNQELILFFSLDIRQEVAKGVYMSTQFNSGATAGKVTIHLLDAARGHSVQTWKFDGRSLLRFGRSEENDVVLTDPSVSRFHTELHFRGPSWELINLGKNGTLIAGKRISQGSIQDQTQVRLGNAGPLLQFNQCDVALNMENTLTGDLLMSLGPLIQIDEAQKDLQVQGIVESPFFQRIEDISKRLRNQSPKLPEP